MAYGNMAWMDGGYMAQRDRDAQQQAYQQQLDGQQQRDDAREAFERQMLQQEQARRQYDSESTRTGQTQKLGVLSGLVAGLGKQMGGGGYSGYAANGGPFSFQTVNTQKKGGMFG